MRKTVLLTMLMAGLGALPAAGQTPSLVDAYTRQLAAQCGPVSPGATPPSLVDRLDLNGDGKDDWVVDAGRYPCPTRSALAAAAGAQVTVFKGTDGGGAVPVFQQPAFGSRLQRTPEGARFLVISVGGRDCGQADPTARCERRLVWRAGSGRFELAPISLASARSTSASPR